MVEVQPQEHSIVRVTSDEEQWPTRRSLCHSLRYSFHWRCLFLTLLILGCVAVIVWCQVTTYSIPKKKTYDAFDIPMRGPCDRGYNFIPMAFATMLYIVYLLECWHCKIRLQLTCQMDVDTVLDKLRQMQEALPIVWWRAVCYHYIRRTRQITRYRNGDAITTTQVYYERVNTHSSGSVFIYHDCGVKDISKVLNGLKSFPVIKIRFSKGFVFATLQAANEFEDQRARFFQENEQRDDYMEVREGLDLMNVPFKDFVIAYANPKRKPWYLSHVTFWVLSLCLLSWPLRLLIEMRTAYVHYHVTKLFGTNYLSPANHNYTGPLTRASTMDSGELQAALADQAGNRENYVIVPSYSEALLMDPINAHTAMHQDRDGNLHIQAKQVYKRERSPNGFLNGATRRGSGESLCNESVIPNYGAIITDGLPLLIHPDAERRSRSLSLARPSRSRSQGSFRPHSSSQSPFRQPTNLSSGTTASRVLGSFKSFSFGNLVQLASRAGYRLFGGGVGVVPDEVGDERFSASASGAATRGGESSKAGYPPVDEEQPPPYEIALQMCRPIFSRIKRSFTLENNQVDVSNTSPTPRPPADEPSSSTTYN